MTMITDFIRGQLNTIHSHLMWLEFPYHSVSVIYRHQDLGLHVIFMDSVRDKVTKELEDYLKANECTWSFVKLSKDRDVNLDYTNEQGK